MKPNTKIALGVLAGVAAGSTAAYLIARSRAGKQAIQAAGDVVVDSGLRLPDPSFAMELPYVDEQFDLLDQLICECGQPVVAAATPDATLDEVGADIQDCVARQLYPQFPWPPVSGDHPTASQLYTELGVLARRAVATSEICPIDSDASSIT